MRAVLCVVMLLVFSVGSASAAERPINDKIVLKDLDRAFEMAAASLGLATVIYAGECDGGQPASCSFQGQGALEIRGIAASEDRPPSNISLFYTADGDPTPFTLNVALLVSIAEPTIPQSERAHLITAIVKAAAGEGGLIDGANAEFSVTVIGTSVIVVAEKAMD